MVAAVSAQHISFLLLKARDARQSPSIMPPSLASAGGNSMHAGSPRCHLQCKHLRLQQEHQRTAAILLRTKHLSAI